MLLTCCQIKREETRHRLLEARHRVELLIMDEHDHTLSLEEVKQFEMVVVVMMMILVVVVIGGGGGVGGGRCSGGG